MKAFNFGGILFIISCLILINSLFLSFCIPVSYAFDPEGKYVEIFLSVLTLILIGGVGAALTYRYKSHPIEKRDGYLIVTFGWAFMSLAGTIPYLISNEIPHLTDAFFETVSGFTTTGASILTDIEGVDKGILLWRSLTQWIGGMGIIVLTIALLPLLGIGGVQLFMAEAPGITYDKLKPRIQDTAMRLWAVYIGLTVLETMLLWLGDMSWFDAINHSLTTMATGGFSTKNTSAIAFSAYQQYVLIVFMLLAGTNFTLTYFSAVGKPMKMLKDEEFKVYFFLICISTVLVATGAHTSGDETLEKVSRDSLFQIVSLITTTGYVSADYLQWSPFAVVIVFVTLFIGGSAGSTAGGVKIVRHLVLVKNSILELKRQVYPGAIIPVRLNKRAISAGLTNNVMSFLIIYVLIFAIGVSIVSLEGLGFSSALGATATCLGNVGPGLGSVGPIYNFAHVPVLSKWSLSFFMIIGRLEIFTVLVLFSKSFWRV